MYRLSMLLWTLSPKWSTDHKAKIGQSSQNFNLTQDHILKFTPNFTTCILQNVQCILDRADSL